MENVERTLKKLNSICYETLLRKMLSRKQRGNVSGFDSKLVFILLILEGECTSVFNCRIVSYPKTIK